MKALYEKPAIVATYTEAQLVAEQDDMIAEGWLLWSKS